MTTEADGGTPTPTEGERLFPIHPHSVRTLPDLPGVVPWAFLAPHEERALKNHSQTLQRLADRGGLGWDEIYHIITKVSPQMQGRIDERTAAKLVIQSIVGWRRSACAPDGGTPTPTLGRVRSRRLYLVRELSKYAAHVTRPDLLTGAATEIEMLARECALYPELVEALEAFVSGNLLDGQRRARAVLAKVGK